MVEILARRLIGKFGEVARPGDQVATAGGEVVACLLEQNFGLRAPPLARDDRGPRHPEHHERRDEERRDHADLKRDGHAELEPAK